MSEVTSEIIFSLENALQLCIDHFIAGIRYNEKTDQITIYFPTPPKNDERWNYFEKLAQGEMSSEPSTSIIQDHVRFGSKSLWSYHIDNVSKLPLIELTQFLLLTRLKKENMLKIAEANSLYEIFVQKIFGETNFKKSISLHSLQNISAIIFSELKKQNKTMRQLSEMTGLSLVALSKIKSGCDFKVSNLIKIFKALGFA